jgi:ERF superfamily
VRKALGQHEIATVQTTAIEPGRGIVTLTTMLAHSSGEWIASDWPVCPIAETANPQRMGAALTYARRYALFTLVGIAGEDDLDAPDLCTPSATPSPSHGQALRSEKGPAIPPRSGNGRTARILQQPSAPILAVEQSAALRDKLLGEVAGLVSGELATAWAAQSLPAKNTLIATDAKVVEDAFESRLATLSRPSSSEPAAVAKEESAAARTSNSPETVGSEDTENSGGEGIDKSLLAVAAPRRYRNRDHLRYVAQHPCLICGRKPSDPHHLRHLQPRALGRKASDEFVVPLCRIHHRLVHRVGNESAWWKDVGIDPVKAACKLWNHARADQARIAPGPLPQAGSAEQLLKLDDNPVKPPPAA